MIRGGCGRPPQTREPSETPGTVGSAEETTSNPDTPKPTAIGQGLSATSGILPLLPLSPRSPTFSVTGSPDSGTQDRYELVDTFPDPLSAVYAHVVDCLLD